MSEQLQNALVDLLTKATSGTDTATAFLSAELPEVVQQLLVWKLAEHSAKLVFALVSLLCALLFFIRFAREYQRGAPTGEGNFFHDGTTYSPVTTQGIIGSVLFAILAIPAVLSLCSNVLTVLQIWLAPKIFLIEYVAYLTAAKGGE